MHTAMSNKIYTHTVASTALQLTTWQQNGRLMAQSTCNQTHCSRKPSKLESTQTVQTSGKADKDTVVQMNLL